MGRSRLLPLIALTFTVLALVYFAHSPGTDPAPEIPSWVASGTGSVPTAEGEQEKKGPSGAMKALQYWGAQRAYPNRVMPDAAYGLALEQARDVRARATANLEDPVQPWESIGPANVGGRTLCLALHPNDPDTIFAGSASGGLWKSTVGGVGADAWDYVDTGYPVLGVSTIAIDPTDPDVMYIGTGEAYHYEDSMGGEAIRVTRGSYGVGILKTVDGGATWVPSLDWTYQQSRGVWMVQIHPTDSDILYAATTEGVYKSIDAGGTWTLVHDVVMAMDVRIHPTDPDTVFAAHGNFDSVGRGIYRTTDGGANWSRLLAGLPFTWTGKAQLAISPLSPDTIYASIADELLGRGLYKSTNRGDNWVLVNNTNYAMFQGWYSHYVLLSPFDEDTLFTGGIEIWKSIDGGTTLTVQTNWQSVYYGTSPPEGPIGGYNYAHADHHFAVWHPTDPNTIFFASDGGIFKSTDLGSNFQSLIGGYQTSQFYNGFSNHPSYPLFAMGGLQDNFTVIYFGTNAWRREISGDGTWTAINQQTGQMIYGSSQYLHIKRSSNWGNNWDSIYPPELPEDYTAFVGPYVLSPSEPTRLYAGRSAVYRSNNEGTYWSWAGGGDLQDNTNPIISLAVSETDADVLYAGTAPILDRARIYTTRDGGSSWDDVTGILPDRYPSDITVDPTDDLKVYVTFMGFGTSHVFRSTDGGNSWADIGAGLPDIPTTAVAVDPDYPDVIYVGTDLGTYFSPDTGQSWHPFNNGMPLAMVNDLKVYRPDRILRAATHGNGAWERDLYQPCIGTGPDSDVDGYCDDLDCAPGDAQTWQQPGEVSGLALTHAGGVGGTTTLSWSEPAEPGGNLLLYDTVSSGNPGDFEFDGSVTCVESDDGSDTVAVDTSSPASGETVFFLVVAENGCGHGSAGSSSPGDPRSVLDCP